MWGIFEPSLEIIRHLMEEQISSAITKNIVVDSIVVIGGFGDSPALREYLRIWLNSFNYKHGSLIDMKFALAYVAHQEHSYFIGIVIANSYYQ